MGTSLTGVGRRALGWASSALRSAGGGVTVLGYHLAGGKTGAPVDLRTEVLERQLDELAADGRVTSLDAALDALNSGAADQQHSVVVTFDDAFRNFFEIAWPLLEERHLPAVLYVPVGFIDGTSPAPLTGARELPPMSWSQVREVARSELITVGSHSVSHPDLRHLEPEACRDELRRSRERLETEIGEPVTSFCYPRALWSAEVRGLVAEVYESAVAAGGRRNRAGSYDRYRISRFPLRRDMPETLAPVLANEIWLPEWMAARWRRLVS